VLRGDEPLCGGLYLPVSREMFWGTNRQAWYNDSPLPPTPLVDLDSPMAFLAVPSNFHRRYETTYPRARSLGSTAAHLAYVAIGAAAGALLSGISLWDIAGLLPVLAATGVELSTLAGATFRAGDLLDGRPLREPVLAAHPGQMAALRAAIRKK
jgi:fructose-1,6-bisphosphatase/inositol monophosphatase family enzyme